MSHILSQTIRTIVISILCVLLMNWPCAMAQVTNPLEKNGDFLYAVSLMQEKKFEESVAVLQKLADQLPTSSEDRAFCLYFQASVLIDNLNDFGRAERALDQAMAIMEKKNPNHSLIADILHRQFIVQENTANSVPKEELDQKFQRMVRLYVAGYGELSFQVASAYWYWGYLLFHGGFYEEADIHLEKSVGIYEKIPDKAGLPATLMTLAQCYLAEERFARAETVLLQLMPLAKKLGAKDLEKDCTQLLIRVYEELGKNALAEELRAK